MAQPFLDGNSGCIKLRRQLLNKAIWNCSTTEQKVILITILLLAKHEFIPWSTEQTNEFLTSVKDSRLFPFYMVAWGAGLRRAEILGLQWPDIDLKNGALTVRRVYVRIKGGHKFQEPKTAKSRRTVPLPEAVTEELRHGKRGRHRKS